MHPIEEYIVGRKWSGKEEEERSDEAFQWLEEDAVLPLRASAIAVNRGR